MLGLSVMAEPPEIADRALELATSLFGGATKELVAMANGDLNLLYEASQIVRSRATGSATDHSIEHLAFSLISTAHSELRASKTDEGDAGAR